MGNSHSQVQNDDLFKQFKSDQWKRSKILGFFQLWQNIKTGQICQAYKLDYVPKQQDLEHYRFRHYNQNADNFVQIRYVYVQSNPTLCNHGQSYVLTEFIPVKLSSMNDLSKQEGYSLLRASYRAFHTMQAFHGPFIPSQDLIGVNLNGKPKIWLNKDHSKNKADKIIKAQIWQKHMGQVSQNVRRILQMVEQKLTSSNFPQQFREYFYSNIMNFSQASEYVQEYCQQIKVKIPHIINYTQYIQDPEMQNIITEYNNKKNQTLNDRLNTIQSYQNTKINGILNDESTNTLKRNQSHNNLKYHQNMEVTRNPVRVRVQNNNFNDKINFKILPRTIMTSSPLIQKVKINPVNYGQAPIQKQNIQAINEQRLLIQHPVNNENFKFPIGIIRPNVQLRSTMEAIPLQQKKIVIQNGPIRQVSPPQNHVHLYQNMKTPQHVTNHTVFIPPNKITQFQHAGRNDKLTIARNNNVQYNKVNQQHKQENKQNTSTQINKQGSIHEKIRQLQKDDSINEQQFKRKQFEYLQQQNQYHQAHHQNQTPPDQQLHQYINHNQDIQNEQQQQLQYQRYQQYQYYQQQQLQQKQNLNQNNENLVSSQVDNETSQPDWEYIQRQKTQNMQRNDLNHNHEVQSDNDEQQVDQPEQYHDQHQYLQNSNNYNYNQRNNDISPIKLSNDSHQHYDVNPHYAMFSQYANQNKYQHQGENLQGQQSNNNNGVVENKQFTQTYKPKNLQLNQSENVSSADDQHLEHEVSNHVDELSSMSNKHPQQSPDLQSSQRMRHLSSKNTSINRGQLPGQSCGTLVIHDSKQNIYQGLNNQSKSGKVIISNIRQQSHESQPEQEQMYQQIVQNNILNEQENYIEKAYENYQKYQMNENEDQRQQERQIQRQQEQVNNSGQAARNQYQNLHFRNQSDDLYQYTPVQSVYRKEIPPHYQVLGHYLPRNQGSRGVQDIVKLQRHQDIEEYIKNKYSSIIGAPPKPYTKVEMVQSSNVVRGRSSKQQDNRSMTFAKPMIDSQRSERQRQDKYDLIRQSQSQKAQTFSTKVHQIQKIQSKYENLEYYNETPTLNKFITSNKNSNIQQNDFLDVGNLEKSLDQKYKSLAEMETIKIKPSQISPAHNVKGSQTMSQQDMNVAALQQKLLKFQERQSIQRQKSQRKIQPYRQEPVNNEELNFNQLDNIVQLMDKKIQESQKKQQSSNTSRQRREQQNVSEFGSRQISKDPLGCVQLQASISNKQMALHNMPILREQHISNASNSNPQSSRQNFYKFGIDSQDFATARDQYEYNSMTKKQSSTTSKRHSAKNYEKYTTDVLSPVIELDKKYQNYSSKNYSTITDEHSQPYGVNDYTSQYRRKSSRRSTRNNSDAQKLANEISNKYDKYVTSGKTNASQYDSTRAFAKKNNYDLVSYDSLTKNDSEKYIAPGLSSVSKGSKVSGSGMQRKRSSYLNTIAQLHSQNNASPFKQQISRKNSNQLQVYDLPPSKINNQQNYLNLSNQNSKRSLGLNDINTGRKSNVSNKNSKISYDELRDLLWK